MSTISDWIKIKYHEKAINPSSFPGSKHTLKKFTNEGSSGTSATFEEVDDEGSRGPSITAIVGTASNSSNSLQ